MVFAADSASTLIGTNPDGSSQVLNVYNHGNKVFNLHKALPIVAMTCGMGHIGHASISTLAKDLRKKLTSGDGMRIEPDNYTIAEVVGKAHEFFGSLYNAMEPRPPSPHHFEFWIGGIGSDGLRGEIWRIAITNGEVLEPELLSPQDEDQGLFWSGQPMAIDRLVLGYDSSIFDALADAGVTSDDADIFVNDLIARSRKALVHAMMPIQDAIALADFLVDVTKRYFSFLPGADVVGGDTDIATVTKHEGFRWIRRKHYYDAALNPRETGHA
jgi:hypothetical protein